MKKKSSMGIFVIAFIISYAVINYGGALYQMIKAYMAEHHLQAAAPAAVVATIAVFYYLAAQGLKGIILQNLPERIEFISTSPEEYPELDKAALDDYSTRFTALGFIHLTDYAIDAEYGTKIRGFARLFVNKETHSYAEVNQVFPEGAPKTPMRCSIMTFMSDGWTFNSTDRKPDAFSILLGRHPRRLWKSCPDCTPEMVVTTHHEHTGRMCSTLGLSFERDLSESAYFSGLKRGGQQQRESARKMIMPLEIPGLLLSMVSPATQWMGDWKKG